MKLEDRDKPWKGASGVHHPLLAEAVVRFQAQTIQEIFPASGPVKGKLVGESTTEREKQLKRVVDYLNYLTTEVMSEYRPETERLLFSLPLAGSAFRKIYEDPDNDRAAAMFVPAEDLVVSYGAADLETCERATHIMRRTPNQVRKLQVSGFYMDIDLPEPTLDLSEIDSKSDEVKGQSSIVSNDKRYKLLEMHVVLDLPGFEDPDGIALPYVVTVEKCSGKILSIYRNWEEDDAEKKRRDHFVHYQYIPGLGFYGFGLVHIIGGLAKTATSLLRQLLDAGTLANLPGGFKTQGLKIKGDDSPVTPGEWRDVHVPGNAIKDNLLPLPYKEPSGVLHQLLGEIVQEGRRFASAADVKAADMNAEAPVGTTLAILEREMKVMSAVQARIHSSMGKELRLLANIARPAESQPYPYDVGGDYDLAEDFDDRVDIIPVSDPNAGTMAQRILQGQAALQLQAMAPEIYDKQFLHRQMISTLGVENAEKIIPIEDELPPQDPVTENMALLKGEPVRAHLYQDHEAHIQVHMSMAENPVIQKLMEKNPQAQAIQQAGAAHVTEHIAFAYRRKIEEELGVPLPHPDEPLPEDIELRLSQLVAPAAAQLTGKAQKQAQAEENAKKQEDPIIQMQQEELRQKGEKVELDKKKHDDTVALKREEMERDERIKAAEIGAKLEAVETKDRREEFKAGVDIVKDVLNDKSRSK
jgi:hypothetical protein